MLKSAPVVTFSFAIGVQKLGQPFKNIRFKIALSRGANTKLTPIVKFGVVKYLKVLEPMMGYGITLDLTKDQVKAAPEYAEKKPVVVLGAAGAVHPMPQDEPAKPE